jgi:Fur family ferric uptake transcriptional regulator
MASARSTRQRKAVADLLAERADFRTAQQLHAELRQRGEAVGLATVYRNLALLVASGEVDTLQHGDGEVRYRLCSPQHHHHLVCRNCAATVEVSAAGVEQWANRVAAEHGFVAVAHTVELVGLCPACAAQS